MLSFIFLSGSSDFLILRRSVSTWSALWLFIFLPSETRLCYSGSYSMFSKRPFISECQLICAVGFRTCFLRITLIFEVRRVGFLGLMTCRSVYPLMWSISCFLRKFSSLLTRFLVSVSFSSWLLFWPNRCYFPVFGFFIGFLEFLFCWIRTAFSVGPVYFDSFPNWPSWSTQAG